jgi:hypothetical protein
VALSHKKLSVVSSPRINAGAFTTQIFVIGVDGEEQFSGLRRAINPPNPPFKKGEI